MSLSLSHIELHPIIQLVHVKSKLSSHKSRSSKPSTSYFMGNPSIHSSVFPFLLCKPTIYLNLQIKHYNPKPVNTTNKMSHSTTDLSHKPKSSTNEAAFNHQGDIQDTKITQYDLNLTIIEA